MISELTANARQPDDSTNGVQERTMSQLCAQAAPGTDRLGVVFRAERQKVQSAEGQHVRHVVTYVTKIRDFAIPQL